MSASRQQEKIEVPQSQQAAPTPAQLQRAGIEAEVRHKGHKTTTLDSGRCRGERNAVKTMLTDVETLLRGHPMSAVATTDQAAWARGAMFVQVVDGLFATLDEQLSTSAISGAVVFTPHQKAASKALYPKVVDVRDTMEKRLSDAPIETAIRDECGVGDHLVDTAAFAVRNRAQRQIKALEAKKNAETFLFYELSPAIYVSELQPKLDLLVEELSKGVEGTRQGDLSEQVVFTLQCLDIGVARAAQFLKDHGAPEVAKKLLGKLPHQHQRRSTDKPEPPPQPPPLTPPATTTSTTPPGTTTASTPSTTPPSTPPATTTAGAPAGAPAPSTNAANTPPAPPTTDPGKPSP